MIEDGWEGGRKWYYPPIQILPFGAPEKSEATTNLQIVKLLQDRKRDLSRATGKLDNIIGKENKSREMCRVEEKETGHFFRKYYFPN